MKAAAAVVAVLACLFMAAATGQEMTGWGLELSKRPAVPAIVVPPDYPKAALAAGVSAVVDVTGRITKDGLMTDMAYRASVDDPSFEAAVREVLRHWIFNSPVDADTCEAIDGEAQARIWFEIDAGNPKVSVSAPDRARSIAAFKVTPVHREKIHYPRRAIQRGIDGAFLIARSRVGPDGKVQAVLFQNAKGNELFIEEARYALLNWRYELGPPGLKDREVVCVEHTLRFRMRD